MGVVANITHATFPRQGKYAGARVNVRFHYNAARTVAGTLVRDDAEAPGVGIIRLDDGRFVLTTECQWTLAEREA